MSEELRIIVNDLRERAEKVQREFESNFDHKEDKYALPLRRVPQILSRAWFLT